MDQIKIGIFLKELRKEKGLTQEQLAEVLNVSNRTISRWETGSNMPDISMLVEIADFYSVSIPEIVQGGRKSETMGKETRETVAAMAKYSHNEIKIEKQKVVGILLSVFGIFVVVSALLIFPNDSSWGGIYSILGSIFLVIGLYFIVKPLVAKRASRIAIILVCIALLFGTFMISDYVAVSQFNQVPRFSYMTSYDSRNPNVLVHKTIFYTVIQKNPGTEHEQVYIVKRD